MWVQFEDINTLSAENQKGINAVQQCSIENQKGTNAVNFVEW